MFDKAHMALAIMQACAALIDEVNRDSKLTLTIKNGVVDTRVACVQLGDPACKEIGGYVVLGRTVTIEVQYKEPRSAERFPIS